MVGGGISHLPGMTGKGYANNYANHQSPALAPGAQDSFEKPSSCFLVCSLPHGLLVHTLAASLGGLCFMLQMWLMGQYLRC